VRETPSGCFRSDLGFVRFTVSPLVRPILFAVPRTSQPFSLGVLLRVD